MLAVGHYSQRLPFAECDMDLLSGVDAWWLRIERPNNLMTVTALLFFEEPIDRSSLVTKLESDLLPFRRFRQRIKRPRTPVGRLRWVDDPEFSLDRHVFERDLPEPTEAALGRLCADLIARPLDLARPLWDIHLVDGAPGPGNVVVARVHHSLADGFSLILLMLALIDADCRVELPGGVVPARIEPPKTRSSGPGDVRSAVRDGIEGLRERADGLLATLHNRPEPAFALDSLACTGRLLTLPADSETSLRGALGVEKAVAWSKRIPVDAVKVEARSRGGTVNDVLLCALSGALRRILVERGEPVDGIDLRAVVPVNIRPFETRSDPLGNGFGLVFLDLPVGASSRSERFDVLKERMDGIKSSPEAVVTFGLMEAVGRLPKAVQAQLVKLFFGKSTAIVTNVPGPTSAVRMAGRTISDIVFFVPQSAGAGLGISIFSYAGSVRVGVSADLMRLAEPRRLVDAYHDELEALGISIQDEA